MFKTRKRLAFVMVVVMLVSVLPLASFASETTPEITYYNADSTKITLDFTVDVGAGNLKNATTLTKDGESVEFTVAKRTPTTTATLAADQVRNSADYPAGYREALVADADYTYEIRPEGGLTFDEMYVLTIDAELMGTQWKKGVTVNKLWKETFDNYASIDVTPWMATHTAKLTLEGTTDKYLSYAPGSSVGSLVGLSPAYKYVASSWLETIQDTDATAKAKRDAIFADTNTASRTFWETQVNEREYNLELEMAVEPTIQGQGQHGIQIYMGNRRNYGNGTVGPFVMAGAGLKTDLPLDKDNNTLETSEGVKYRMYAGTVNMFASSWGSIWGYQVNGPLGYTTAPSKYANMFQYMGGAAYAGTKADSVVATSDLTDDDLANDVTNKISMSVKDKNIKFAIDSDAKSGFTSYNYTQGLADSDVQIGLPVFIFETYGYHNSYYHIDNIIATKAVFCEIEELTVDYWNADTTKITLDLNAAVAEDVLEEAVTLTSGDGKVEFELTKLTTKGDALNSYMIKPNGGIAKDAVYTLSIAPGAYTVDSQIYDFSSGYAKSFKVERYLTEEFDYTDENNPWNVSDTSAATVSIDTDAQSNKMLKVEVAKYAQLLPKNTTYTFADTGLSVADVIGGDTSTLYELNEYNTEIKVKAVPTSAGKWNFRLYQTAGSYDYQVANIISFKLDQSGMVYRYKSTDANNVVGGEKQSSTISFAEMSLVGDTMSDVTISYKDGTIKNSVNNAVYTLNNLGLTFYNIRRPLMTFETGDSTYYIDRLVYSKAIEVTGLEFDKTVSVKADGESVEALGQTPVDVSISVRNYGAAEPCKVILAAYGTDCITNAVLSDTVSFVPGKTTFNFDDFDPKGGTKLRIFFWDGIDTLVPYCNSVDWPAAE